MIKPKEIQQKAREAGVRDQQIEKDYILSWILKSISRHERLKQVLVFKGGTVLKKFYQANNKRVKVDISRSEKLEFEPVVKTAFLAYSDVEEFQLLCYRLEEVLVEKMRSVMQRMQARDFYDIWYLLEQHQMEVEYYLEEFAGKCAAKNLNPADFPKKLAERLPQYRGRWQSSLSEQIQNLPKFEQIEREVNRRLRRIEFSPRK